MNDMHEPANCEVCRDLDRRQRQTKRWFGVALLASWAVPSAAAALIMLGR